MGVIEIGLQERADEKADQTDAAGIHRIGAEELLLAPG